MSLGLFIFSFIATGTKILLTMWPKIQGTHNVFDNKSLSYTKLNNINKNLSPRNTNSLRFFGVLFVCGLSKGRQGEIYRHYVRFLMQELVHSVSTFILDVLAFKLICRGSLHFSFLYRLFRLSNSNLWVIFCHFSQEALCQHLRTEDHLELVSVLNRSIPTVIRAVQLVPCTLCNKLFRLNISLKKHMQTVHSLADFQLKSHEKFKCDYCEYWSYKETSVHTHKFLGNS